MGLLWKTIFKIHQRNAEIQLAKRIDSTPNLRTSFEDKTKQFVYDSKTMQKQHYTLKMQ